MDFCCDRSFDHCHDPVYHIVLQEGRDDGLLDAAFLEHGEAESLENSAILLLFEDLGRGRGTLIILLITTRLLWEMRYSTPLRVLLMILIRATTAYLNCGFGLSSMFNKKSNFSVYSILNTSFLIS